MKSSSCSIKAGFRTSAAGFTFARPIRGSRERCNTHFGSDPILMSDQPRSSEGPGSKGIREALALERNVAAASAAMFLLGFGEELWKKFLPKYLESLGAGTAVIGLFGTLKDFLDAIYQYPGGWLADRVGRRRAFFAFIAIASTGYLVYLLAPSWPFVFLGLVFAMGWASMASPAIFSVVGDALPKNKRAMGFTFQSLIKRVPMAVAPMIGGSMIAALGIRSGVRKGLIITLILAAITFLIVRIINIPIVA